MPEPGCPVARPSDNASSAAIDIVNGTNPDFGITDPLAEGIYEIQVRATDEVGNLGPDMIELFEVDTTPPETALASGPEGLINTRDLEYVLGSSQGQSTFLCEVEGQNGGIIIPLGPCPGPNADGSRPTFTVPADDIYTLTAIAVDPATNQDPTPAGRSTSRLTRPSPRRPWTPRSITATVRPCCAARSRARWTSPSAAPTSARCRDSSAGSTRLTNSTGNSAPRRSASAAWPTATTCSRSGPRMRPRTSTRLPEVLEWTVDVTPPVTSFTVSPDPVTNDANPSFEFSTNEAVASSECALDGGAPVPCTSPFTLSSFGGPFDDGDASGDCQVNRHRRQRRTRLRHGQLASGHGPALGRVHQHARRRSYRLEMSPSAGMCVTAARVSWPPRFRLNARSIRLIRTTSIPASGPHVTAT